jgi:hypothetical protein
MAVYEVCLEMKIPGKAPRASYNSCLECRAEVECCNDVTEAIDDSIEDAKERLKSELALKS